MYEKGIRQALSSGHVQYFRGMQNCLGGKFLPDPSTGHRLFSENVRKVYVLLTQAPLPSRRCPSPILPYLESSQGLLRLAICHQSDQLQVTNLCVPHRAPVGIPKHWDPTNTPTSNFLWLLPMASQGMKTECSAVLFNCSSRRHFPGLTTWHGAPSYLLRSWCLFPEV